MDKMLHADLLMLNNEKNAFIRFFRQINTKPGCEGHNFNLPKTQAMVQ